MSSLRWQRLWEGSSAMKLEMKFTDRDRKLITFLVLFLLIVGVGYFVLLPLYTSVEQLKAKKEELEQQVMQTEMNLARLPKLIAENEQLEDSLKIELSDFYPYMESQKLDEMITGLTLDQGLGAKNLSIAISDTPYVITPYFLSDAAIEAAEAVSEEAQMSEAEEAVYSESTAEAAEGEAVEEGTATDGAEQILYVAKLSVDVTGEHKRLQDYIDLLSSDTAYPAIQIDSYSWSRDSMAGEDAYGALIFNTSEQLHLELSVYMQAKQEV